MSSLSIGLITSGGEENERLVALLQSAGAQLKYQISPQAISQQQIEDEDLHVWLLNVDDDSWDDQLDLLLDQSEIPVYFNEPGTLSRQSHPDFWCENLIKRLIDLTGLAPEAFAEKKSETVAVPTTDTSSMSEPSAETTMPAAEVKSSAVVSSTGLEKSSSGNSAEKSASQLTEVLEELEDNSINLPADIANELVLELEDIAPELKHQPKPDLKPEQESKPEKESFSLTETISPDDNLDFESDEINDSDIENIADEEFDFSVEEMALDLDEDEATDIDSFEIAEASDNDVDTQIKQVADEILSMQAQEEQLSESPSVLENETLLDFPEDSELTLETHRENDDATLKASFESDEQSTEDVAEIEATADDSDFDFELDDIALEDDSDIADGISADEPVVEESVPAESELALADDSEALSTESAVPVKSSAELSDELEDISIDGLSLEIEETSEEKIVGKASFHIDESDAPADVADESNSSLTAEASAEESAEDESEFSFSLESFDNEERVSGRAQFKIDEGDESLDSSATSRSSEEEPEAVAENSLAEEMEEENLTLEALPEEQADWLAKEESEQEEKIEPTLTEQIEDTESTSVEEEISIDEMSFDFDLEEDSTPNNETSEESSSNAEVETINARVEPEDIDVQNGNDEADEFSFETAEEEHNIVEPTIDDSVLEETLIEETTIHETAINQSAIEESTITEPAIELPATEAVSAEDDGLEFDIPMLEEPAGDVNFETPTTDYFEAELLPCWILGASLGGPASLKQFLQKIPENINASFVIAQHIDESFLPVLAEILSTNSAFNVEVANGSNPMKPGTVLLAPLKGKIIFLRDGSLMVDRSQKWSEPYSPCIDDVIKAAAEVYGRQSGAIIFSGMGHDGLEGARIMKEKGGQVWAQQPETCANSSMPEAIINQTLASYIAAPDGLATSLSGLLAGEKATARS